ncbi:MAG: GNAT family N-acetyltransferase [Candidatus Aenigmarchaeota archaeon]|nr:GNAT family N-acetyltransferase [Candidatus Aenigmarchaeota archaeon]
MKMAPGRKIDRFMLKDGREVVARLPRKGDERKMMRYINELAEEKAYISVEKKKTIKDEKKFLRELLAGMKSGKKTAFVFESGGRIIAMADSCKGACDKDGHVCKLALGVLKDFRGAGLGNLIMRMLIDASRKKLKCRVARLSVYAPNKPATSLYRKHGFRVAGRIPKGIRHCGEYIDEMIMVKEI